MNTPKTIKDITILASDESFHHIARLMKDDPNKAAKFCNALYKIFMMNTVTICRASDYTYIPNAIISLKDKKKFGLNTLAPGENAVKTESYDLHPIDNNSRCNIIKSLDENLQLYQPIWSVHSTIKKSTKEYFIFDGTHRFLALLDRLNKNKVTPKTLMCILIPEKLDSEYIDLIVPDLLFNCLDFIKDTYIDQNNSIDYNEVYTYSLYGLKIHKVRCKGFKLVQLIIINFSMYIDIIYKYQKDHNIQLIQASDIIHTPQNL